MGGGSYVLIRVVIIFLDVLSIAMLVRALLSWIRMGQGQGPIGNFVFVLTEPVVMPIRTLFERLGWFQGGPLDMSFFITMMLISLLNMLLNGMLM